MVETRSVCCHFAEVAETVATVKTSHLDGVRGDLFKSQYLVDAQVMHVKDPPTPLMSSTASAYPSLQPLSCAPRAILEAMP